MQRRYITVDVFTDRAFGGNPLAVVLDAGGLSTAQMQAIAIEFNYSETTFVLPPRDPAHDAQVRIFTVSREIPFAGHPNVGTAFVLATRAIRPESIIPAVVMDSGLARSLSSGGAERRPVGAPRNENRYTCGATRFSILTRSRSSMISAIHCRWQCK
jgi:predicted PhzF superfamily epimerase YddE/YHI9